jgi:hypothetical protein
MAAVIGPLAHTQDDQLPVSVVVAVVVLFFFKGTTNGTTTLLCCCYCAFCFCCFGSSARGMAAMEDRIICKCLAVGADFRIPGSLSANGTTVLHSHAIFNETSSVNRWSSTNFHSFDRGSSRVTLQPRQPCASSSRTTVRSFACVRDPSRSDATTGFLFVPQAARRRMRILMRRS